MRKSESLSHRSEKKRRDKKLDAEILEQKRKKIRTVEESTFIFFLFKLGFIFNLVRNETLVENRPFVSAPFSELLPAFFEPGSEGDLIPAIPSSQE